MPDLIQHITRISGCRDRSELNQSIADAVYELFRPTRFRLLALVRKDHHLSYITLADLRAEGPVLDEYSMSSTLSRSLSDDALLFHCVEKGQPQQKSTPSLCRYLIPVVLHGITVKVVEINFPAMPDAEAQNQLFGLVQLYANLLRLLDYGETDTLTGLLNRKTFEENLNRILTLVVEGENEPLAFARRRHQLQSLQQEEDHWLCVIDIDHFKSINDNWGHIYGDEVLLLLAQLMRHAFRYEDKLFRFGGEEFVVMLQPMHSENAFRAFDRFRKLVETNDFPNVGRITVSIGFTRIKSMDTPTEIIGRADEALYFVKQNGRNDTKCYETLVEHGFLHLPTDKVMDIELF